MRADLKFTRWVGYFVASSGLALATFLAVTSEPAYSIGALVFTAIGAVVAVTAGEIYVDSESIQHRSIAAVHRLAWDEIVRVDVGISTETSIYSFVAPGKRLRIPGPEWWHGPQRDQMVRFVDSTLKSRGIPQERSLRVFWQFSSGCRAKPRPAA